MDNEQRLHFLAGEVSALRAFAIAVIASSQDLARLGAEFARLSENQITLSTPAQVRDEYLEGQRQTLEDLQRRIDAGLAKGTSL